MSGACVHELADGTPTPRFRPYYITFYWLSSPWREQKERCERRARLEARKKTSKPAPWIRTHKSSILHVSMAPGNNVRFAIFFFPLPHPFSIRHFFLLSFSLRAFCFAFFPFSFFFRLSPFFSLFSSFFRGTSDTRDMKLRESERGGRRRRRRDPLSFETTLFALDCFERIRHSARIVGWYRVWKEI